MVQMAGIDFLVQAYSEDICLVANSSKILNCLWQSEIGPLDLSWSIVFLSRNVRHCIETSTTGTMSCSQTILDGRWHSSNCWQHLLQSSPAKLVLNDPIYSLLVFEKKNKLLVSNWRVTFGSVHRTSCNSFLLPAARLLATVFLSCSMLHVAMAHLGSLIQHLWWIYDINWHHTYHTTSNVPFFGPHIESGYARWCQMMPRDAKHQQEEIWTNSPVTSRHHVQGLLPLPLPFNQNGQRQVSNIVCLAVCLTKIPHQSVFGWFVETEDRMTYKESTVLFLCRLPSYLCIVDIYILHDIMMNMTII